MPEIGDYWMRRAPASSAVPTHLCLRPRDVAREDCRRSSGLHLWFQQCAGDDQGRATGRRDVG